MESKPDAFDRFRAQMAARPWHVRLRSQLRVKWMFLKLDLCGADPFIHFDKDYNEVVYARRPWLYRLLVEMMDGTTRTGTFRKATLLNHAEFQLDQPAGAPQVVMMEFVLACFEPMAYVSGEAFLVAPVTA
jgi:hypothetical protein